MLWFILIVYKKHCEIGGKELELLALLHLVVVLARNTLRLEAEGDEQMYSGLCVHLLFLVRGELHDKGILKVCKRKRMKGCNKVR